MQGHRLVAAVANSGSPPWTGADPRYLAIIAALFAVPLGYLISSDPEWLQIGFDPTRLTHLLGLLIGIACAVAILKWPEAGTLGLVALIYTNASDIGVRFHQLPSMLQLLLPLLAIAWLHRRLVHRPAQPFIWNGFAVWLLIYGTVIFASSALAADPHLADLRLFEYLKNVFILLLLVNLVTRERTLWGTVWVLIATGAVLGTISCYQVFTGAYDHQFGGFGRIKLAQIVGEVREPRIAGPLSDPNFYAQILVVLIPLALYRVWDESSWRLRAAAAYALAVILLALFFTYSRGGALALGVVLLLAALHKKVGLRYVMITLCLLAPLTLMLPERFEGRLGTLHQLLPGDNESVVHLDSALQERKLLMRSAWEMFMDRPLLGVGAGNYTEHYDEYAERIGSTVSSYEGFDKPRFPHSLYLEVAAETGLAGLSAFAAIIVSTLLALRSAYRCFMASGNARTAGLVMSLALGFVGYLTTSLFLHGDYMRHFWLLVGLALAAKHIASTQQQASARSVPHLVPVN